MNWGTLVQAIGATLVSILSLVGIGGRQHRRRTNIKANLELLEQLRESSWHEAGFHEQSRVWLESRIGLDIARLSGINVDDKKPIPWGSVILAVILGGAAALGGWLLSSTHFNPWSVPLWVVAALMFIGLIGQFTDRATRPDQAEQLAE